ncbi:hypothetical protein E2C01_045970 [Portunus trituberculatus]|uniref:Uncharacterized protein n=1 Tax=Portunus trituberculatus TaxID=210409 RepID=A0A5B7G3I9_PORTR|nr:hypothetical protein [Portunus trituberculatus]
MAETFLIPPARPASRPANTTALQFQMDDGDPPVRLGWGEFKPLVRHSGIKKGHMCLKIPLIFPLNATFDLLPLRIHRTANSRL